MKWQRVGLSVALVGGCIWCLGRVQQVHSEAKAAPGLQEPTSEVVTPLNAVSESEGLLLHRSGNHDHPLKSSGHTG